MSRTARLAVVLGGALLAGSMAFSADVRAESGSATWVGPNGGTVHWRGYGEPGY